MTAVKLETHRYRQPVILEIRIDDFIIEKTFEIRDFTVEQLESGLIENAKGISGMKYAITECSDIPEEFINQMDMNQLMILTGLIKGILPDSETTLGETQGN